MSNDPKQDIMEATYKALCKHGYADISIQKIADESDKGKSLIYYHYDDKEDLMLAFLDYMSGRIDSIYKELESKPADQRLDEFLDTFLGIKNDECWEIQKAFLQIRAQASHDDKFASKFREADEMVLDHIEEALNELGVEETRSAADLLLSLIEGSVNRKVSVRDREGLEKLKDDIKAVVRTHIVEGGCVSES